jgi:RNA polymerase sigma-70 factor (ECF subfamily)
MAGAVLRKVSGRQQPSRRIAHLDADRALVEAAVRDPLRFDALYRKYVAQVYSYAVYELGDHHDAEDATERTFVSALVALPRFEERARPDDGEGASTFRVWLFRIARNVVANLRRDRRRHPQASIDAAVELAGGPDPEGVATRRAEVDEAWSAVAQLPDDRRRAVVLRFVEEMSTAEIAGVLGRSEGAVRVLLHRALRSVSRELDRARVERAPIDGARVEGAPR